MTTAHEAFEQDVMQALLRGDDAILGVLRLQYNAATAIRREFTGVGFFTHWSVPESARLVTPTNIEIDDLEVRFPALEHGAGVILFVRNGAISILEGLAHAGESWPEPPSGWSLSYLRFVPWESGDGATLVPTAERDVTDLRARWAKRP